MNGGVLRWEFGNNRLFATVRLTLACPVERVLDKITRAVKVKPRNIDVYAHAQSTRTQPLTCVSGRVSATRSAQTLHNLFWDLVLDNGTSVLVPSFRSPADAIADAMRGLCTHKHYADLCESFGIPPSPFFPAKKILA